MSARPPLSVIPLQDMSKFLRVELIPFPITRSRSAPEVSSGDGCDALTDRLGAGKVSTNTSCGSVGALSTIAVMGGGTDGKPCPIACAFGPPSVRAGFLPTCDT